MIAFSYYLLKVVICSGILYGYYYLALRDKVFHQWNRFYLLGSIVVSIFLPLVNISMSAPVQHNSKIISALEIVTGADEFVRTAEASSSSQFSMEMLAGLGYTVVSLILLFIFMYALNRIQKMIRRNQSVAVDDFYFLNTNEPGTPFSFFRFLLWNKQIALDTENGRRILEHELVHIREKHSWDKIFVQLTLVVFWINPFFWIIRRELTMVHEFIADRKAVGSGDPHAFATLLLETSFPGYAPIMTNTFFKTSIKRRLSMITKTQNPAISYFSRLMMIPLLFILLFAFGVKAKTMLNDKSPVSNLDNIVTVVVDAGHGGNDAGTQSGSVYEKDISLAIARLVKKLNENQKINIVLSRNDDVLQPLSDKVKLAEEKKASLFLSLHVNSAPNSDVSGILARVGGKSTTFDQKNIRFASLLVDNLSQVYKTEKQISRPANGVFVLDKNVCPAAMLELGYITNEADRKFITSHENQEKIAKKILESIEEYFSKSVMLTLKDPVVTQDSIPVQNIKSVTIVYKDGTKETLTPEQYKKKMGTASATKSKSSAKSKSFNDDKFVVVSDSFSVKLDKVVVVNTVNDINVKTSVNTTNATGVNNVQSVNNVSSTSNTQASASADGIAVNVTGSMKNGADKTGSVTIITDPNKPKPLYIVDGNEVTEEEMKAIDPNKISSVNILKGDSADKAYGTKGKNGVVVINLKK